MLETTDTHANLLAYDYHADRPVPGYGLSRVATLIRRARRSAANCLLFDNGDFLQGTPLSDLVARPGGGWRGTHPVIGAMNALGYDAATVGNHEFNFGLDWLTSALSGADFPFTCANARLVGGEDRDGRRSFLPRSLLLKRAMRDSKGHLQPLVIGVMGLIPPQVTTWDRFHLAGRLEVDDMIETARALAPRLRAEGADLVIALAHTGIDTGPDYPGQENAALALGGIPGIDVLLAGHTHQVFPGGQFAGVAGADPDAGTLNGTPAVMAGFRGSHLGQIDLSLEYAEGRWRIAASKSQAIPVEPGMSNAQPIPEQSAFVNLSARAHRATLSLTQQPLGVTARPLHSYLTFAGETASVQLVTRAQIAATREMLADRLDPAVPVLAASASFKTGGRGGAWHYTNVPAGPLFLRHAADLYPFPNVLCVLRLTGSDLRDWLERAAMIFNTIVPGRRQQPLLDPGVPGHAFDIIDGLSYRIDLSQPPLYGPGGQPLPPGGAGRIRDLRHRGRPVRDGDRFLLATNNYRAFGGGPYPRARTDRIEQIAPVQIVDLLADHIRSASPLRSEFERIWSFVEMPGTEVIFETGPGLRACPGDIAAHRLRDLGDGENGFARFAMPL